MITALAVEIVNNMMVPTLFPGDYRVEERPIPELSEGDVLVKILAVGICAGDAKCFAGAPYFWGTYEDLQSTCSYKPQFRKSIPGSETHPQYVQPPVIPGHEFIGEVVKLAPGKLII